MSKSYKNFEILPLLPHEAKDNNKYLIACYYYVDTEIVNRGSCPKVKSIEAAKKKIKDIIKLWEL